MLKPNLMFRTCAPAIAAALAFTSTALPAQEADPSVTPVESSTSTTAAEAPAESTTTTVTTTTDTATEEAATPAPATTSRVTTTTRRTTTSSSRTAAPAPARSSAAAVPAAAASDAAPVAAEPAVPQPQPNAIAQAAQDQAPPPSPAPDTAATDAGEIAFGGALALLVLSAGALGLSRRRKRAHEEASEYYATAHDAPVATPVVAAPVRREIDLSPPATVPAATDRSAFAWGSPTPATASPIERAMRGPSPDNPSLSLKKRLKRAAFFERREREAAAGRAPKMSRFAGLPDRLVDAARRSTQSFAVRPAYQPA